MNDHLKAHRDFQQVMDDSMSKLRETFQTWLQQRQEQVVNLDTYTPEPSQYQKIPICYDDDDDEYSFATQEYLKKFSSAITPDLPKSDSLIMEDEHLDTIPETESDELIKSSVEDLVHTPSESDGFIDSNNDYSSSDDDSYEDIDYADASPPDSELVSLEVVEIVIPEVDGLIRYISTIQRRYSSLPPHLLTFSWRRLTPLIILYPNLKLFALNLEEISSGSTTTHSDYSLPDYEAFYHDDNHIEEKSSGSTTTHADFSQYDSFIFDLSINPFPPADRSNFYKRIRLVTPLTS
ncbi:hypothetical protein Tco_0588124 [Tanacetum coccineum]